MVAVPAYHLAAGRVSRWAAGGHAVPETYTDALRRAGVVPVILPAGVDGPAADLLARFDGLLLVGGGDVEPRRYGAEPHPSVYGVEPDRDELEIALACEAVRRGLPVFAVCRGLQLLNVAFGGTLHQHVPELLEMLAHGVPTGSTSEPACHDVRVAPDSRLAKAAGGAEHVHACTSVHHQAVDRVGDGLVPVAWSHDGLVEALERPAGEPWLLGVQWHPEMTAATDPGQQALFDAFAASL
jgi:putative glutamine amidotransferase